MAFNKNHSEETKKKISKAMSGKRHPRYGEKWDDEQRVKFQLTVYNRKLQEQLIKNFLIKHNTEWENFQVNNKQK